MPALAANTDRAAGVRRASVHGVCLAFTVWLMAWMWWLLAPVASTAIGATVIWWRAWRERSAGWRRSGAMSEHRALLRALPQGRGAEPVPVTMRVLHRTAEMPPQQVPDLGR